MSARIAPAKRAKIEERRQAGERMQDIAKAEGVSESTVRRVCKGVDADVVLRQLPASALTETDVARLRLFARLCEVTICQNCGQAMVMRPHQRKGTCLHCGIHWHRKLEQMAQK